MALSPRLLRPRASGGFDPRTISGCICNLDASVVSSLFQSSDGTTAATATDDPIGYWGDLSGLGNHAKQTVATGSRPFLKLNNQNGRPGLLFDGSNDWMTATIAGFQSLANVTVIQVFKTAVAAAADTATANLWAFGNAGALSGSYTAQQSIGITSSTSALAGELINVIVDTPAGVPGRLGSTTYSREANTAQLMVSLFGGGGTSIRVNDAAISFDLSNVATTSTPSGPSNTGWTVDNEVHIAAVRNGSSLLVSPALTLHQMIVYNRTLTTAESTAIWNAMRGKWGIV